MSLYWLMLVSFLPPKALSSSFDLESAEVSPRRKSAHGAERHVT